MADPPGLSERVARLEAHQEHAATREDVLQAVQQTNATVLSLVGKVDGLKENMASKYWVLSGMIAAIVLLIVSLVRWFAPSFG